MAKLFHIILTNLVQDTATFNTACAFLEKKERRKSKVVDNFSHHDIISTSKYRKIGKVKMASNDINTDSYCLILFHLWKTQHLLRTRFPPSPSWTEKWMLCMLTNSTPHFYHLLHRSQFYKDKSKYEEQSALTRIFGSSFKLLRKTRYRLKCKIDSQMNNFIFISLF